MSKHGPGCVCSMCQAGAQAHRHACGAKQGRCAGQGGGRSGAGRCWRRRTDPQDSSSRLLSAASTSETASLASATAAAANTRRVAGQALGACGRGARFWPRGAGHLVVSRDQVCEQLGYNSHDFLGRANAHDLELRHGGFSPSKALLPLRTTKSLLKFSRWPFTGPRLARPCARTSRAAVRNESGSKLSRGQAEAIGCCGAAWKNLR